MVGWVMAAVTGGRQEKKGQPQTDQHYHRQTNQLQNPTYCFSINDSISTDTAHARAQTPECK